MNAFHGLSSKTMSSEKKHVHAKGILNIIFPMNASAHHHLKKYRSHTSDATWYEMIKIRKKYIQQPAHDSLKK